MTTGFRDFDSFGANDNARITAMNAYHRNHGGRPLDVVMLPSRIIAHTVPIELWSGMAIKGAATAREFGRRTQMTWQGNGSQFVFTRQQTNQSYPGEGSPRDVYIANIQFNGAPGRHWMPRVDPSGGQGIAGQTLWYFAITDCGWMGFETVWWGYGTGTSVNGITHLQAIADTAFCVGGSENSFFEGGYSFQDSGTPGWMSSGRAFFRNYQGRSRIGGAMLSARGNSQQLLIQGTEDLLVHGLSCDAPSNANTNGAQIKITGGRNIIISGCGFKGGMHNPGSGPGGAGQNRGIIDIRGGSDIVIEANRFIFGGGNNARPDTPLVFVGGSAQRVKIGLNAFQGWQGIVQQERSGLITCIDPGITVRTG